MCTQRDNMYVWLFFFFSSRRRHTRLQGDWSSDVCSSDLEEQAVRAREALKKAAVWKESASLPPAGDALYEHMMALPVAGQTVTEKTSAAAAPAVKRLEARYTRPYQAHGSIGPSCAVAQWQEGKLAVWTHSQGVFPLRADLAQVFGVGSAAGGCPD